MTFLNGNLREDVYMTQHESFVNQQNARKYVDLGSLYMG
jgi:hypothetical protein